MYTKKEMMLSGSALKRLLLSAPLQYFYKQTICLGSILSLSIYTWVRLLFHDFPFEIVEETTVILQTLLAGWVLAAACIGSLTLILFAADNHTKIMQKFVLYCIVCCSYCKNRIAVKSENNKRPARQVSIELPEMTMRF